MLTSYDLSQIRKVIREEVEAQTNSLRENLNSELKLFRIEIQTNLKALVYRIKNIEILIKGIQKDLKTTTNLFDKETLILRGKIARIQNYLKLRDAD